MDFFLGTHRISQQWWDQAVPFFVSRRQLSTRKRFPLARTSWALDSGGFTELETYGEWRTTENEYVTEVERFAAEVGHLQWAAPQDWMCEPFMLDKTGLTIAEHQERTVANFLSLRARLGPLVIPVLQGWELDDYLRCADLYERADVSLADEPVVGLGSVCRRQDMTVAGLIVRRLASEGFSLHGFGVKITGIRSYGDALASSDSLAWSYNGRRLIGQCPDGRKNCANCLHHALTWRAKVLAILDQLRLEVSCVT